MNNPFNTSNTKQIKCVCICCCFAYSSQSVVDTYASAPHRHIEITQYSIGVRFFYRIFFVSAYTANRCQKFRFVYETYCYIYKMQNRLLPLMLQWLIQLQVVQSTWLVEWLILFGFYCVSANTNTFFSRFKWTLMPLVK